MTVQKLSYTYEDAEDATGVSVRSLKRAVSSGELKTLNPRIKSDTPLRRVLIDPAELERWLHNK
ncbi:hypothetical protein U6G28_09000 [Actinomycetaceae bacterium MB13-C1-2]|nr:hypothetical protein U6G28_09000 [Actinomycetaceae bacterium MB13-C1-2]